MPLESKRGTRDQELKTGWWWPWIENGFWVIVFVIAYVAMMKVMHPGWSIFGI